MSGLLAEQQSSAGSDEHVAELKAGEELDSLVLLDEQRKTDAATAPEDQDVEKLGKDNLAAGEGVENKSMGEEDLHLPKGSNLFREYSSTSSTPDRQVGCLAALNIDCFDPPSSQTQTQTQTQNDTACIDRVVVPLPVEKEVQEEVQEEVKIAVPLLAKKQVIEDVKEASEASVPLKLEKEKETETEKEELKEEDKEYVRGFNSSEPAELKSPYTTADLNSAPLSLSAPEEEATMISSMKKDAIRVSRLYCGLDVATPTTFDWTHKGSEHTNTSNPALGVRDEDC